MKTFMLDAVDAFFFRDGRPYRMGQGAADPGNDQSDVVTLFPPSSYTLVGALRAGLAMERGWKGPGSWGEDSKRVLGDGMELGALNFRGPFLVRGASHERLYRMPAHYVERKVENRGEPQQALLAPEAEETHCDIGQVHLPALPHEQSELPGWKARPNVYVTFAGLCQILKGEVPGTSSVIEHHAIYETEARLGLRRDPERHTTEAEGALYSPSFVRLDRDIRLLMEVDGIPDDWRMPKLVPLGGEGRMAIVESQKGDSFGDPTVEITSADGGNFRFLFVALTPLRLPPSSSNGGAPPLTACPGGSFFEALGARGIEIESACIERSTYVGGWDSIGSRPLPAWPHLPAGSVLFCRADNNAFENLRRARATGLGPDARFGVNQFVLGRFPTHY